MGTAKPGTFTIEVNDGFCSLNGWAAITVSPQVVLWQKAGRMMEWQKITDRPAPSVAKPASDAKPPKKGKDEADQKAKQEAEQKKQREAEQKAKQEAEKKAKLEADKKKKEEARLEAEKKKKEEAEA